MGLAESHLEKLFRDEHQAVSRALAGYLNDPSGAEELTQEAFARAWKWTSEHPGEQLSIHWVYVVAFNLGRSALRRRLVATRAILRFKARPAMEWAEHGNEDLGEVRRILASLTERQRLAVVLRAVADLSSGEAALIMGCSEATVRVHYSRGIERLRKDLGHARD